MGQERREETGAKRNRKHEVDSKKRKELNRWKHVGRAGVLACWAHRPKVPRLRYVHKSRTPKPKPTNPQPNKNNKHTTHKNNEPTKPTNTQPYKTSNSQKPANTKAKYTPKPANTHTHTLISPRAAHKKHFTLPFLASL